VNGKATVVIVSHSKSILKSLCDKVYFIQDGKIASNGDLEEAFELYESERK
jgi:ABC-type polysaccharide/polyol phosphate transport system ATPase subunit